jgi:hypothetical protein
MEVLLMVKDIPGYDGRYRISSEGKVYRHDGAELRGNVNSYGYHVVSLMKQGKKTDCKVHRLVAIAFLPNPHGYECVNHIDGDKLNNDVSNLEWCTKGHNNRHARETLNLDFSEKPVCQMDENGNVIALWRNAGTAATIAGYSDLQIRQCCRGTAQSANGYSWKYAGDEFNDYLVRTRIQAIDYEIEKLAHERRQLLESATI